MRPEQLKIAILWVVREFRSISLEEIERMIREHDSRLPQILIDEPPSRLLYGATHHVDQLLKAGLIKTEDDKPMTPISKLAPTQALGLVQDLFSISLTEQMRRTEASILTTPMFGAPRKKNDPAGWARIFVAMPFLPELKPVHADHISKVAQDLGVSCKRGDDFFNSHNIMDDVWSAIFHAELCIVDCTGRNPNVFYELGIAHTLGRKAILITQSMKDIPFDIRSIRTIEYQYTPRGMEAFENTLKKTIKTELHLT